MKVKLFGYILALLFLSLYLREVGVRRALETRLTKKEPAPSECRIPVDSVKSHNGLANLQPTISALSTTPNLESSTVAPPSGIAQNFSQQPAVVSKSRIARIERFTELTSDQRQQLEELYAEQDRLRQSDLSDEEYEEKMEALPKLADIIGADAAAAYNNASTEVFRKLKQEATEKETLLVSKRLGLSPEQEGQFRDVLGSVEQELAKDSPKRPPRNPQEIFNLIRKQTDKRTKLLGERLRGVLSEEQYRSFAEYQANSPGAEMELWHGGDVAESDGDSAGN